MSVLRAPSIRFPVDPRGVGADKAARRLGMTAGEFADVQDRLFARGFPRPDPDTGRYDLKAIDAWMDHASGLTVSATPQHVAALVQDRLGKLVGGTRRKT